MRIAIVTETFLPKMDGIVRMLTELLDHLARRGQATQSPRGRLIRADRAGHYVHRDRPDSARAAIRAVVDEISVPD